MITEIVLFFNFHSDHCYGNKFLQHIYAAYQSNCPSKNGVKQIKNNKEKLSQSDIYPNAKEPDSSNRVEMQQKLLFTIKLTFVI